MTAVRSRCSPIGGSAADGVSQESIYPKNIPNTRSKSFKLMIRTKSQKASINIVIRGYSAGFSIFLRKSQIEVDAMMLAFGESGAKASDSTDLGMGSLLMVRYEAPGL